MKILVVEDNRLSRISLISNLEELGYSVFSAKNGIEALTLFEEHAPSMVITDLEMPEMDGFQLIKEIRAMEFIAYTYIIAISVETDENHSDKSFECGADDMIEKPIKITQLNHHVKVGMRLIDLIGKQSIIFALAQLTETRDLDTGNHTRRISTYSKVLARYLREQGTYTEVITNQYISNLIQSSILHDIGKVGIDDSVLKKKGLYTVEEREVMKTHTTIGAYTLKSIKDKYPSATFLSMAIDIAQFHHEKFDGTGYPTGLKGDQIPLAARIVAVADVFDALVSERVYKEKFKFEDAAQIIIDGAGKHFDPIVVDAFVHNIEEFKKILIENT
jgi:putative two-component system response regulator